MLRTRSANLWICVGLITGLIGLATAALAADDTARFYGTWETSVPYNGQMVTVVSVNDPSGFKNYMVLPTGNAPAGSATFSAANGRYTSSADKPNDSGTYHFIGNDTVVLTNAAGQTSTWKREKVAAVAKPLDGNAAARATTGYIPPTSRPGNETVNPGAPPPAGAQPAAGAAPPAALASNPSLPPETNAAIAAFNQKDYNTAWGDFMAAAQKGDSEAEAGVGAMLFNHLNPPGTGYYAQCEKWLLELANQGNVKGMDFLGQYYYASGVATAGGINPGINNAPIPPALQQQAEGRFALARKWLDLAAAKGDIYAAGNLAIMLDSGVGGPRDPVRAAQLRAEVKAGPNADFAKRATADPSNLAMSAAWQSGHYADALQNAQALAAKGDASAEALLGRAYYEGVGVARNYPTALTWLNRAIAQNNADAMFILGLMYEYGRGVNPDVQKAVGLFDKAAALGQPYAKIEAAGMRMEGAAAAQQARYAAACQSRGGIADGPVCSRGGLAIDPY